MPRPIKRKIQHKETGTEDEVLSFLERMREAAAERPSQLMKVAAVAGVVIVAILVAYFMMAGSVKEANRLHYEGYKAFHGLYSYELLGDMEQAQKALEYFNQAYAKKKTPQTLMYIANSHFRLGETDKGIETLDRLVKEFPGADDIVPLAQFRMGSEYRDAGQKEQALDVFEAMGAVVGSPLADMALIESARILESLGRDEEAIVKYEAITLNYPSSPFFAAASQKTGAGATPGIDIRPLEEGAEGEGQPGIQIMPAEEGGEPGIEIVPMGEGTSK